MVLQMYKCATQGTVNRFTIAGTKMFQNPFAVKRLKGF